MHRFWRKITWFRTMMKCSMHRAIWINVNFLYGNCTTILHGKQFYFRFRLKFSKSIVYRLAHLLLHFQTKEKRRQIESLAVWCIERIPIAINSTTIKTLHVDEYFLFDVSAQSESALWKWKIQAEISIEKKKFDRFSRVYENNRV